MYKHLSVSEFCPITQKKESVSIAYKAVSILGESHPHYKLSGYSCTNKECPESICPFVKDNSTL